MTRLLQVGISSAAELGASYGHIACTLGGVNYESRGGIGCVRGSAARGATNHLFRHHYHRILTDARAAAAKEYADRCVGQPYVLGSVPTSQHGGDCSGLISGLICAANGEPIKRLFSTATWPRRFDDSDIAFAKGIGGGGLPLPNPMGVADRPYPGRPFNRDSPKTNHVVWIQARLNFDARNKHPVLGGRRLDEDGLFGDQTFKVVVFFQRHHGLQGLGQVGPKTWRLLLAIR